MGKAREGNEGERWERWENSEGARWERRASGEVGSWEVPGFVQELGMQQSESKISSFYF